MREKKNSSKFELRWKIMLEKVKWAPDVATDPANLIPRQQCLDSLTSLM